MQQRIELFHFWRTLFRVIIGTTQLPADSEIFFWCFDSMQSERRTKYCTKRVHASVEWTKNQNKMREQIKRPRNPFIHGAKIVYASRVSCAAHVNVRSIVMIQFSTVSVFVRESVKWKHFQTKPKIVYAFWCTLRCCEVLDQFKGPISEYQRQQRRWRTVMAAALSTQLFCSTCFCVSIAPEALGLKLWSRKNCFTFSIHSLTVSLSLSLSVRFTQLRIVSGQYLQFGLFSVVSNFASIFVQKV